MRVHDLGPLIVEIDGRQVDLGTTKQAALLTILALHAGHRVSADKLMVAAWGEQAAVPSTSLDSALWRLRNVVDPARGRAASSTLIREGSGYRLAVAQEDVDSLRFEQLANKIAGPDMINDTARLSLVVEAHELWRGRPCEAMAPSPESEALITRFEELRDQIDERRVEALLGLGQLERAIADLEPLIARSPYRERLWGQRMLALAGLDRIEEALATYTRLRRLLDADLGLEPGSEIKHLHARILSRDDGLSTGTRHNATLTVRPQPAPVLHAPAVMAPPQSEVHLPRRGTELVGRDTDLARLTPLVSGHPLITLTGAGGSGKTRLAVEVARALADHFVHGIWFVDLTAATTSDHVLDVVTSTLALGASLDDAAAELTRFAGGRHMLIILDNCEHVIDAAAQCAEAILGEGPRTGGEPTGPLSGPTVLATSREPLDIDGEIVWSLAPLDVRIKSDGMSPAAELFCARMRADAPETSLGGDELMIIEQICHALDGLPLAIELAAAGARWFTVEEVADQVRRDPSRLARIGRGRGGHRDNLYTTIEWSYQLLSSHDRALHRSLAVLPGQFSLSAASGLLAPEDRGDLPQRLSSLAHRSLLVATAGSSGRRSTFAQLATVRAHAQRQLIDHGEETGARQRRDEWVQDLLRARPKSGRPGEASWYTEVEESYPVIRATLQQALATPADLELIRLGSNLTQFWYYRSRMIEGRRWLQAAHDAQLWPADDTEALLLRLGLAMSHLLGVQPEMARPYLLNHLDRLHLVPNDHVDAMIERLVGLATSSWACRDLDLLTLLNQQLQLLARRSGDEESALLADAVGCVAAANDPTAEADIAAATKAVVARAADMGNTYVEWIGCMNLFAVVSVENQDLDQALTWLRRAIDINVALGDGGGSIYLEALAVNAARRGDHWSASRYFGAARTYLRRSGMGWALGVTPALIDATHSALGPANFERAHAEGDRLTLEDVARTWHRHSE